jgi:hypothetical protein
MQLSNADRQSRTYSLLNYRRLLTFILGLALGVAATGCDLPGFGSDPPPEPPSGLNADSEDSAIALDWEVVQGGNVNGYNVYRSTSAIAGISELDPVNGGDPVSDSSYTDATAENGTTYHYVVTAVNSSGTESNPSGEVQKTPFADPPDRP